MEGSWTACPFVAQMGVTMSPGQPPRRHPLLDAAGLTRISRQSSAATRDKAASTWLRLLTVITVPFKYASAR